MPSQENISGVLIKKARIAKKLSTADLSSKLLAHEIEVSAHELKVIENQQSEVTDIMIEKIAQCLEVTVTSLLQE